jgi:hypothetical protein
LDIISLTSRNLLHPLIYFSLNAIYRSWVRWMEWVRNPEIMAVFTIEELKEMSENLCKFAESFLEYDMKITERITQKKIKKKETKLYTT